MNNKKIGTKFERYFCSYLSVNGWWVHFISPDRRGAQPFDIVAVRNDVPVAIDCKTCFDKIFRLDRLEDNQKTAFSHWISKGNSRAYIIILHQSSVYAIRFERIFREKKIDLSKELPIISEVRL